MGDGSGEVGCVRGVTDCGVAYCGGVGWSGGSESDTTGKKFIPKSSSSKKSTEELSCVSVVDGVSDEDWVSSSRS